MTTANATRMTMMDSDGEAFGAHLALEDYQMGRQDPRSDDDVIAELNREEEPGQPGGEVNGWVQTAAVRGYRAAWAKYAAQA